MLKKAIDSVLNQTYENIELIVVDDNGKNSEYRNMVVKLVEEYNSDSIVLLTHEKNEGVQRARNNGIATSKGEYIALLDDDDEWLPDKITEQMNVFMENKTKNIGIVYCWYNLIKVNADSLTEKIVKLPVYPHERIVQELLRENFIGSNSFPLLSKKCVLEVGGYDEKLPSSQDLDLWIRLSQISEAYCVNKPLVNYYAHVGKRISNNTNHRIRGNIVFYEKYRNLIDEDPLSYLNLSANQAYNMINAKKNHEARETLINAYKKNRLKDISLWQYWLFLKSYLK